MHDENHDPPGAGHRLREELREYLRFIVLLTPIAHLWRLRSSFAPGRQAPVLQSARRENTRHRPSVERQRLRLGNARPGVSDGVGAPGGARARA